MRLPFTIRRRATLAVIRTEGEFPHARRSAVKLACCSCSSCVFLLGAGLGGLVGFFAGAHRGWISGRDENVHYVWRILQAILMAGLGAIAVGAVGLVIGAAVDYLTGV